jgi:hypothetical protein
MNIFFQGWCSRISGRKSNKHGTDETLVKSLSQFLAGKRVASFGDGPGLYKEKIEVLNQVKSYEAFDGAPFAETTTENRVSFLDLSVPIYHLDKYDWIVSVEVAEHIPKEFENIFIDNLARHAKEGVIMSWANVGQTGTSHVNERNFDYVKAKMEARGFVRDVQSSEYFQKNSAFPYFKRNLQVWRKLSFD